MNVVRTINFESVDLLELLSSKICHDLISPIGAINNGLEVLEEIGPDAADDVMPLIAFSAQQASARLKAFRLVYGAGGADAHIRLPDVHAIVHAMVSGENKIKHLWDPHTDVGFRNDMDDFGHGFCKILCAGLLLAMEALLKGGEITLHRENDSDGCRIDARGHDAGLRRGTHEALTGNTALDDLEPYAAHALITGVLCQKYGFTLDVKSADNVVHIRIGK